MVFITEMMFLCGEGNTLVVCLSLHLMKLCERSLSSNKEQTSSMLQVRVIEEMKPRMPWSSVLK